MWPANGYDFPANPRGKDRLAANLPAPFKENALMSDGIRRIIALSVLLLGTGLLWVAGRPTNDETVNAKSEQDAALQEARERAAAKDPRLQGAYRYDRG